MSVMDYSILNEKSHRSMVIHKTKGREGESSSNKYTRNGNFLNHYFATDTGKDLQ